ncbi:hypothetical protein M2139_001681 [Enterococcus sp. PF1-24]|uniref:helix-turn-helix domain-containing protein n=1 Tax=unclassified Enterococcus TaxID=2608891 RepID=UPI002476E338|nr:MULTISPECIES: helix-turn-helix domain-containing protein [unclassified Enterococcus]MDH6364743.1 hypothetical protein [Enterococcus sp. PFB1-1]MDH6401781.1 hypothetical protein [Enterococcus sp. PF1-24]
MLKRAFIEKPYDIMNDILLFLYNNDGCGSKTELTKIFNISMNTLNEYIILLNSFIREQNFQNDLVITADSDKLTFSKSADFSINRCHLFFLKKSIKYQILRELFENAKIDSETFQKQHSISPATYYRKISELNELLSVFDLSIKRNQIVGDEPQIRYFFFSVFWAVDENTPPEAYPLHDYSEFYRNLEKILQTQLDSSECYQQSLWLDIAVKRMVCQKQFVFPANYEKMDRPLLSEITKAFEDSWLNEDTNHHEQMMFYDFFVSMRNYSPVSSFAVRLTKAHEKNQTTLNQINQSVFQYLIDKNYISENITEVRQNYIENLLFQIHAKNYYFKGFILSTDSWGIDKLLQQMQTSFTRKDVTDLMEFCQLFFNRLPYKNGFNDLQAEFNYTTLFYQLTEVNQRQVTIAVYHSQNTYLRGLTMQFIQTALGTKYSCEIVPYEENNNYDILLTNREIDTKQSMINYIYTYTDCTNAYDIKQIEKIIQSFFALKKYLDTEN